MSKRALRELMLFSTFLMLVSIISMSPLDKAQAMYNVSLFLQTVTRKIGETAIKLEYEAYKKVSR